ncbi:hypothetical protein TNCV_989901 [Trichonephila clavipes]|nr:hypothetical protein TNCV_989901 [Trichonephila clavipes]
MPSPDLEPRPYGTAVSITNHYTGWAVNCSTGVIDDRNRNFKFRSSQEDDTQINTPSENYRTKWKILSLDRFNEQQPPQHRGSSVAPGLESMTFRPRIRNHNH